MPTWMEIMAHESVSPVCLYRCAASGLHLGPSDAFLLGAAFSSPSCLQFLLLFVETFLFLRKQVTEEIQKKKKKNFFISNRISLMAQQVKNQPAMQKT